MVVVIMHALLEEVRLVSQLPRPEHARAVRVRAKVSLRRLAQELGVHEITVHRWETGTSHPRGRVLLRYAELIDALQKVGA